jgi:hypothetical protein
MCVVARRSAPVVDSPHTYGMRETVSSAAAASLALPKKSERPAVHSSCGTSPSKKTIGAEVVPVGGESGSTTTAQYTGTIAQ